MMKINKLDLMRTTGIALLIASAGIIAMVLLSGCAPTGPVEQVKSPKQIWIEAHPTHAGPNGECIEFDDEPCDDDPFDTNDMTEYDKHGMTRPPSAKPTTKVRPSVKATAGPKPTKRR